ncbi:hypothetical protein KA005_11800, partial [bacterium]|nr:hypothetical protein [bacterium]
MKQIYLLIVCIFGIYTLSSAQGFNASGLGMGGAYGALARGVDAFAWNPANLALKHDSKIEINLAGFNLNAANSALTIDEYKRYFTESGHEGHWDEGEIDDLLALIPEDGLDVNGDVMANVAGLLFDRFGLSLQGIGKSLGVVPKSVLELYLKGNQDLYRKYGFNDFDGDAFSAVKLSLSLSQPIPFKKYFDEFGVGLNINYYYGVAMAEAIRTEGSIVTTNTEIISTIDIVYKTSEGGRGIGFDLGVAGAINDKWSVSVVLNNIFAGIEWSNENWQYKITTSQDTLRADDLFDRGDSDKDIVVIDTLELDPFRTNLPAVFHFGVAYDLNDKLTFALDLEQAFGSNLGYSDKAQIAVGVQYAPTPIVPLRAGMSFGG